MQLKQVCAVGRWSVDCALSTSTVNGGLSPLKPAAGSRPEPHANESAGALLDVHPPEDGEEHLAELGVLAGQGVEERAVGDKPRVLAPVADVDAGEAGDDELEVERRNPRRLPLRTTKTMVPVSSASCFASSDHCASSSSSCSCRRISTGRPLIESTMSSTEARLRRRAVRVDRRDHRVGGVELDANLRVGVGSLVHLHPDRRAGRRWRGGRRRATRRRSPRPALSSTRQNPTK